MDKVNVKNDIIEEFKSQDKDIRLLTYRVLLENFNNKYSHLSDNQKLILKEFINSRFLTKVFETTFFTTPPMNSTFCR